MSGTEVLQLEPLLTAEEVASVLRLPVKSVYELPIPKVKLGRRRVRWRAVDVEEFIGRRTVDW